MPFIKGHPEYRTEVSIKKLKKTLRRLHADKYITKVCPVCKSKFTTTKGRLFCRGKERIYCSRECKQKSPVVRAKISLSHFGIKVTMESKAKMSKSARERHKIGRIGGFKRGNKHWAWNNGISNLRHRIHAYYKYKEWRTACFLRDDYMCQLCGKRGGKLEVDHYPKLFSQILKEFKIKTLEDTNMCDILWDISNGRTLCQKCHKKFGGNPRNSKQLPEEEYNLALKELNK